MKINIEKTEICLFMKETDTQAKDKIEVTLNQQEIKYNKTPKILGVIFDESLNFQSHTSKEKQKANKALSSLKEVKFIENINTQKLIQLYTSKKGCKGIDTIKYHT